VRGAEVVLDFAGSGGDGCRGASTAGFGATGSIAAGSTVSIAIAAPRAIARLPDRTMIHIASIAASTDSAASGTRRRNTAPSRVR
jgi:hypothetical protein